MSHRQVINQALAKALAYADCGKFEQAQQWGEVLIRQLEIAAVFKAGSVHIDGNQTLWMSESRIQKAGGR